jgi:hypothetical protein
MSTTSTSRPGQRAAGRPGSTGTGCLVRVIEMYETQVCSDRYRVTMTSISSRKPDEADERAVTRSSPCSVSPPCAPPQPLSEAEGLLHPCCTGVPQCPTHSRVAGTRRCRQSRPRLVRRAHVTRRIGVQSGRVTRRVSGSQGCLAFSTSTK